MRIKVIIAAQPIVTPADVPSSPSPTDARVAALIKAAQGCLAGPRGWLGRSLGKQTLEFTTNGWWRCGWRLPCPPVIEIVSLSYRDAAGVWQALADADRFLDGDDVWLRSCYSGPSLGAYPNPVRVQYRAGYEAADVPEEAKQAVILMVQDMLRTGSLTPGLRSETVEGVGSQSFMDSDRASLQVKSAVESLVGGLWVPNL